MKQIKGFQQTLFKMGGKLSGNNAYQIVGSFVDDQSLTRQLLEVGTALNNKVYILQFNSNKSKSSTYLPILKDMFRSFQIFSSPQDSSEDIHNNSLPHQSAECGNVQIRDAQASGFETDPNDYNPPADAIDSDLTTWWANQGVPSWLQVDLEKPTVLCSVEIAWNKGNERTHDFVISTSSDGDTFTDAYTGHSSGKTLSYEQYDILDSASDVEHIKLSITGSSSKSGWVSVKEIKVSGK